MSSENILYVAIGAMVLGFILLLMGVINRKEKTVKPEPSQQEVHDFPPPQMDKSLSGGTTILSNVSFQGTDATVLLGGDSHQTVLLGEDSYQKELHATLHFIDGKKVTVQGERFVIGRNPESSDYAVNTTGVSRSHLEIFKIDHGNFGIRDLGSKNGTKLNGIVMQANKEYLVKESDVIQFAKEEFTIKMG